MISRELILELQKIAKEEQNKNLSFEEASKAAENLVGFFDALLEIDYRNKNQSSTEQLG